MFTKQGDFYVSNCPHNIKVCINYKYYNLHDICNLYRYNKNKSYLTLSSPNTILYICIPIEQLVHNLNEQILTHYKNGDIFYKNLVEFNNMKVEQF